MSGILIRFGSWAVVQGTLCSLPGELVRNTQVLGLHCMHFHQSLCAADSVVLECFSPRTYCLGC